ncbi:MAG: diaminopimelate decarboxylase [Ruminococcaceae bacterium]|nr:diaminopimelate decarboxylase [Oscillospiraceae bacterium]
MLYDHLSVNERGHLTIAGRDTVALAEAYGTPLMVMDEARIRARFRLYREAMTRWFGGASRPLFASKALSCRYLYRLAREEGVGIDLVSSGELYTALASGFDVGQAFFHGNNKTDADITYAMDHGVGWFVVDNLTELDRIEEEAAKRNRVQPILLRLTPGIDPHTHAAITTGQVDSKFGIAIETGQADEAVAYTLAQKHIRLDGFHCHIGSQIFEITPFCDAAKLMIAYVAQVKARFGYEASLLNLGGGFGVRYIESQPQPDYADSIRRIASLIDAEVARSGIRKPTILMEPGRSIVADACVTLYTVGGTKDIPGFKHYVSVDGGMPDNPRYALYQSDYTVCLASRMKDQPDYTCTVAGRCCESGDLLQENVCLPKPKRGDILAVLTTGAYNYSMASNYNRIPRPAVVAIRDGEVIPVIRRESFEDLIRYDL